MPWIFIPKRDSSFLGRRNAGLKVRSSTVTSIFDGILQSEEENIRAYFSPFGYTRILLASPVFRRSMPLEKSFIEMRSVITG